jgi:hypothetical protein
MADGRACNRMGAILDHTAYADGLPSFAGVADGRGTSMLALCCMNAPMTASVLVAKDVNADDTINEQ